MRASHKKRIARLIAALDEAERRAFDERCELTLEAVMCRDIRAAMQCRGIDPGSAWALRQAEARVTKLVASPELETADAAWLEAHPEEEPPVDEEDPLDWLADELWRVGERYLDGSQPDLDLTSYSRSGAGRWFSTGCFRPSAMTATDGRRPPSCAGSSNECWDPGPANFPTGSC
jgi:hypothetical protein